ncbi:MAG: nucleotidyltransferase substrate binding protein [Chloroflexus sp.]|jgi:nucleotidyltransferase substrate binding protein (TIGR01987 family)|nr:nucleotidyltransferase substrate binding protein [Chloroflexus sp.]MBO9339703.1 nucleotidyltransferase substrate binding protein [Chloroflexus sp.]
MSINTDQLQSVLRALETALVLYERATATQSANEQEVFRMAIIKGFELAQEISFKLIKRRLRDFGYTSRRLEATPVKELLRLAAQHSLLSLAEVERWFSYRDNRNSTAHDYGEAFVQQTLCLLPNFIRDAHALAERLHTGSLLTGEEE